MTLSGCFMAKSVFVPALLYSEGSTFKDNWMKSKKHTYTHAISDRNVGEWLVSGNVVCRYSKAFLGQLSSDQSGVVEVDELQFLWYKFNPEILTGYPEQGHQTRVGWENKLFSSFMRRYLEIHCMRYDQSYYWTGVCCWWQPRYIGNNSRLSCTYLCVSWAFLYW